MGIDLYGIEIGAPTRSVFMVAKILGLDVNYKNVDLLKKEQLNPEFLKMNPQHTVPTLDDNGFYLWESRAIVTYLIDTYAKDDSLYPKDTKKRALVNQRLYFDGLIMYQRFADVYYPKLFLKTTVTEDKVQKLDEAYEFLNTFLSGSEFVAGDHLTVADLCLVATVTTAETVGFDLSRYPKVVSWLQKCKSVIPAYEETNGKGVGQFHQYVENARKG